MEYIRIVDFAAIGRSGAGECLTRRLFDRASGVRDCPINFSKMPGGCIS